MTKLRSSFRAYTGLRLVITISSALFLTALFTASAMMKSRRESKQTLPHNFTSNTSPISKNAFPREKLNELSARGLPTSAAGPITVTATAGALGPTDYLTLKDAFDAINAGTHQGIINISVLGDTTESASAVLNASGSGSALYTSILIQPAGGVARMISGNLAAPLVDLSGADFVTFDGLNSNGNSLTLSNLSTSNAVGTSTLRFINGAGNNVIRNCTVLGSSMVTVGNQGGTILLSTTTSTGNNNNTISGNSIGPAGSDLPLKAVTGFGSSAAPNTANVIDGNNIFDFFGTGASSVSGIDIRSNDNNWTISNNRIYQTAPRLFTAAALRYAAITINAGGGFFTITGNTIGFSAPDGTGTTTISGSSNEFRGLDIPNVSTTSTTIVQANTISGISQSSSRNSTSFSLSPFIAMSLGTSNGLFDVSGNTIGIFDFSSRSNNISSNNIGALTIQGTGTTVGFRGILANTASAMIETVNNNIIGGAVPGGAITDTQVGAYAMYGIQTSLPAVAMSGNTIGNISGNSNSAGALVSSGLAVSVSASSTRTSNVSHNTVHSLSNTSGTASNSIYGIDVTMPATANVVERNFVHSLSLTSTATSSQLWGIVMRGQGSAVFKNNMVRLGLDAAGNSIT